MFDVKSLGDASQTCEIMTSVAVHIRHAGQSRTNTAHLRARVRGQHLSKKLVELVMRTDPCPLNRITGPFADSANVPAHSHRPVVRVAAQLLELWRIVPGIFQKQRKGMSCRAFLRSIQLLVRLPKAPSRSGNHMRFKSSGSLPSAVACSMKARSLGRGVASLMIASQRSSSTCAG